MPAYNLFRHRDKQHVICAVPEGLTVPGFLAEKTWEFVCTLAEPAATPSGSTEGQPRKVCGSTVFTCSRISARRPATPACDDATSDLCGLSLPNVKIAARPMLRA